MGRVCVDLNLTQYEHDLLPYFASSSYMFNGLLIDIFFNQTLNIFIYCILSTL